MHHRYDHHHQSLHVVVVLLDAVNPIGRRDVNREDWKTIDAWLNAVLVALPAQPLKTAAELGGAQMGSRGTLPLQIAQDCSMTPKAYYWQPALRFHCLMPCVHVHWSFCARQTLQRTACSCACGSQSDQRHAGVTTDSPTQPSPAPVAAKRWSKNRPYPGMIVAIEGLCTVRGADDKDTVRVEIDVGDSGLAYNPGDALGIYPRNCPEVRVSNAGSCRFQMHRCASLDRSVSGV